MITLVGLIIQYDKTKDLDLDLDIIYLTMYRLITTISHGYLSGDPRGAQMPIIEGHPNS